MTAWWYTRAETPLRQTIWYSSVGELECVRDPRFELTRLVFQVGEE